MSRQLHKYNLKVLGYEFVDGLGRDCLENIVQNNMRRYPLFDPVNLIIRTNQGSLHIVTAPGFVFVVAAAPKSWTGTHPTSERSKSASAGLYMTATDMGRT